MDLPANDSASISEQSQSLTALLRGNEILRLQLQQSRVECLDLQNKLAAAQRGSHVERESRRAALNLMEDAQLARLAAQRETLERKRIAEELQDANLQKDEFLAILAHELRNPLAPIRNSLHILRVAGPGFGDTEQIHEMMERQVDHMVRLVDDLMEASRITRGKIELRKTSVELAGLIRSAVETSRPGIDAAGHQLAISLPSEPLVLDADSVRISQVLANLLNNAAKYTPDGGQIWLSALREGNEVLITVKDSGIGIPSEMLPRVFDLFTQVDRTDTRSQGGLGIGLTLVRTLVEMHGGTVTALSEGVGKGTELQARLPLAQSQHCFNEEHDGFPDSVLPNCKILVVDDNHDAVESLSKLLELIGIDVCTAHDGNAALEAVDTFHPAIVLLDIGMPGMNGYEIAKRIRERFRSDEVTLIALTGWGQDEDRRRARDAGFDHHLIKPLDLEILKGLIHSIMHDWEMNYDRPLDARPNSTR